MFTLIFLRALKGTYSEAVHPARLKRRLLGTTLKLLTKVKDPSYLKLRLEVSNSMLSEKESAPKFISCESLSKIGPNPRQLLNGHEMRRISRVTEITGKNWKLEVFVEVQKCVSS